MNDAHNAPLSGLPPVRFEGSFEIRGLDSPPPPARPGKARAALVLASGWLAFEEGGLQRIKFPAAHVLKAHILEHRLELSVRRDAEGGNAAGQPPAFGEIVFRPRDEADAVQLAHALPEYGLPVILDQHTADFTEFGRRLRETQQRAWVTPALAVANIVVFLLMTAAGANLLAPSSDMLLRWGADFGPYTLGGQWWRLVTNCFIHVGILHLAFNLYALLASGQMVERLFGSWFFAVVYIGCGVAGSMASVGWKPTVLSAGASGAIFGVYGALLGYAARQRHTIPWSVGKSLAKSTTVFIGYNLLYGLASSRIDQAAHVGGLVSCLVFGFAAARPLELAPRRAATVPSALLLAAAMAIGGGMLAMWLPSADRVEEQALQSAASRGDATAAFALGIKYETGQGVPRDPVRALAAYRAAADLGHSGAAFNAGRLRALGLGGPTNLAEAAAWYRRAADLGLPNAQALLGLMYEAGQGVPRDHAEAARWFRRAADLGAPDAQGYLGMLYLEGKGVPRDPAAAARWLEKGAVAGNANAQFQLGNLYVEGLGVGKDRAAALKWFKASAAQGNANAQAALGLMYSAGLGIPRDPAQALYWYRLAASRDHVGALAGLASLLATTTNGAASDPAQAVSYAEKAVGLTHQTNLYVLETLAQAYAAAGRESDAVVVRERVRKAIEAGKAARATD